jgi:hypothetical protein
MAPARGGTAKAQALAACEAKFGQGKCYDTGTASYIGYTQNQGNNCTIDPNQWLQYCYASAADAYNCNTCTVGVTMLAHAPCTCGQNTAVYGSYCQ